MAGLANARWPAAGSQWPLDMVSFWHAVQRKFQRRDIPEALAVPDLVPHETAWHRVVLACKLSISAVDKVAAAGARRQRGLKRLSLIHI
eukprot:12271636-Alexandrium_andersonii.AAC.1